MEGSMRCRCIVSPVDRRRTVPYVGASQGEQGAADRDSEQAVGRPTKKAKSSRSSETDRSPAFRLSA
jgi:hypothetical protein